MRQRCSIIKQNSVKLLFYVQIIGITSQNQLSVIAYFLIVNIIIFTYLPLSIMQMIELFKKRSIHQVFLLRTSFPLALSGATLAYLVGDKNRWCLTDVYSIFVLFSILAVYNLHRFKKIQTESTFNYSAVQHALFGGISLLTALVIFIVYMFNGKSLFLFGTLSAISAWYVLPFFKVKLREVKILKSFSIAFCWTIVAVYFPQNEHLSIKSYFLIIGGFLFFLALTIPFDLRDMEKDGPGKTTIPQIIGVRSAKVLSVALMILGIIVTLLSGLSLLTCFFAFILLVCHVILLSLQSNQRSNSFYTLFDLLIILYAGLIAVLP